jgi:hypothetical protein
METPTGTKKELRERSDCIQKNESTYPSTLRSRSLKLRKHDSDLLMLWWAACFEHLSALGASRQNHRLEKILGIFSESSSSSIVRRTHRCFPYCLVRVVRNCYLLHILLNSVQIIQFQHKLAEPQQTIAEPVIAHVVFPPAWIVFTPAALSKKF